MLKLQHMFNLYRDFDQELTQNAKLQHLFQKVNSDGHANCIAALPMTIGPWLIDDFANLLLF